MVRERPVQAQGGPFADRPGDAEIHPHLFRSGQPVTFTDEDGEYDSFFWVVDVSDPPPNRPPTITGVLPSPPVSLYILFLTTGDRQTFEATASDPDDNLDRYEWFVNGQSRHRGDLSLTGPATRRYTHTFSEAGNYTVTVTFTDEDGEYDSFFWVVDVSDPPLATDTCFQSLGALTAALTRDASWTGACASTHRSSRYARFYSFTLDQRTEVQINLTSSQDTFLYLLRGADADGAVVNYNDDVESGNTNSRITETLAAGTYTIEATTYGEGVTGSFTLEVGLQSSPGPVSLDAVLFSAGTLNGQRLSTVTPSLSVTPGQAISGTVHIAVQNDHRPGAIFPVGATPTWGDHQSSYWSVDHSAPSFSTTSYEVPVALTAPSTPGVYAIVFAAAPETSLAHVMSATRWYSGPPRWNNGDDIAGWDASRVNFAMTNGYVIAPSYPEDSYHFGATAIRIVVNPTGGPPPATDGCFQSLGALTAALTRNASWTGDCASTHRSGRYARFYSFTLNQQTEVQISLTSSQDTFLYLLRGADANGTEVTNNDDVETGNTNSQITRTLAAGTYTVEATTYSEGVTGDFTLSIVPAGTTAPPPATDSCFQSLGALTAALTRNASWTGDCASTHRSGRHARFYSFTLNQQTEVQISLTSSQDTFLYLLRGADANGTEVTNNDDVETGNTNSQITRTLAAGTYTVEATTYSERVTGDFTLSIVPAGTTAPPPATDSCFQSLGALTAALTRDASWTGDCASTHRSGRYGPLLLLHPEPADRGADQPDLLPGHLPVPAAGGGRQRDGGDQQRRR